MKNVRVFGFAAAAAILTWSAAPSALAVVEFGWERPIESSRVEIESAIGAFEGTQEAQLTITRRDGSRKPTGFIASIGGRELRFRIQKIGTDRCGTVVYTATGPVAESTGEMMENEITLTVQDHEGRFCRDLRRGRWEGRMEDRHNAENRLQGVLEFAGNPEPIYTIQEFETL